jgi:hypothetical protein
VLDIFEIGSIKRFAWIGLELRSSWSLPLAFFCVCVWQNWDLNSGHLWGRVYHLSHAFSPFCFGDFEDSASLFAHANLDLYPPIYASCYSTCHCLDFSLFLYWDGVLLIFFPWLAWNLDPLDLSFPSS